MRKTSSLPNSTPDSTDFPYGGIIDETQSTAGTPVIEATYSDFIQSLWQFFRVTATVPNGLRESQTNGFQLFNAMEQYLCPVGTIRIWPSNVIPSGWLVLDGSQYSILDYPDLNTLIGDTYGTVGNEYNLLPDLKDKMPLCKGIVHTQLAGTGGEEKHELITAELPAHQHYNGIADDNTYSFVYGGTTIGMPGMAVASFQNEDSPRTYQGKTSSAGSGIAHNNMPPYLVLNFIIKAAYGKTL